MEKLFVKKFIPVYQEGKFVCIGYANDKERYLEMEYSDQLMGQLQQAVREGISSEDLDIPLFSKLNNLNFLEPLKNFAEITDINRDRIYFQYLGNDNFNEGVFSTRILIFGAGAGGSTITYMLAQMGFHNLVLVDFDTVSKTDIHKSVVLKAADIGMPKVEAVAKHIRHNFGINIQYQEHRFIAYDDLEEIIGRYNPDFIIKACDPELIFRSNLSRICFGNRIPYINMAYAFEKLRLGPLYIPGFTSCDESFNNLQKKTYGEHYDFRNDRKLFVGSLVHPAVSFNVSLLGAFILKEIVMYLTGQYEYCFTIGRLVVFNPLSLEYHYWNADCEDNCPVCKPLLTDHIYENN